MLKRFVKKNEATNVCGPKNNTLLDKNPWKGFLKKNGATYHDTSQKTQFLSSNTFVKDGVYKKANENLQVHEGENLHVSPSSTSWFPHSSVSP